MLFFLSPEAMDYDFGFQAAVEAAVLDAIVSWNQLSTGGAWGGKQKKLDLKFAAP